MALKSNNSYPVISCHLPFLPELNPLIYKQKRACTIEMQALKKKGFGGAGGILFSDYNILIKIMLSILYSFFPALQD